VGTDSLLDIEQVQFNDAILAHDWRMCACAPAIHRDAEERKLKPKLETGADPHAAPKAPMGPVLRAPP
jgi:hypothetical protein